MTGNMESNPFFDDRVMYVRSQYLLMNGHYNTNIKFRRSSWMQT
jgi:hypothetical protein